MNKFLWYALGGILLGVGLDLAVGTALTSATRRAMEPIAKNIDTVGSLVEKAKKL